LKKGLSPSHDLETKERETLSAKTQNVKPGPRDRTVYTQDGELLEVPEGWELLPPGDAGLTRKVKSLGPSWTVQKKRGRRTFSQGIWAPKEHIDTAKSVIETKRMSPAYQRKLEQDRLRRKKKENEYAKSFYQNVLDYLDFDEQYQKWAELLARAVAEHATPVGSGTVARTKRIPIEQRAEAAVIAWMRHQTSAYDHIKVPRRKGARRELRRKIAERSRRILNVYRKGMEIDTEQCPLYKALQDEELYRE
tara:strand:- start:3047 stop:3796 length:750 start_codon:yes stop_codon:yes gene_type:complete